MGFGVTGYRDRLRRLSPDGTTGTVEWALSGGITSVSDGIVALFGVSRDRLVGRQFQELFSPASVRYLDMIRPQLVDGIRGRYELELLDGSLVRVEWTYHSQPGGTELFDMTFWEIEEGPSYLPRLQVQAAAWPSAPRRSAEAAGCRRSNLLRDLRSRTSDVTMPRPGARQVGLGVSASAGVSRRVCPNIREAHAANLGHDYASRSRLIDGQSSAITCILPSSTRHACRIGSVCIKDATQS